ncbi:MAG: OmpA family protein, partial [Alphaproteobacteria bacterium]|nr:OmpA family protein [Alphaproteobacteria bacterium]
LNEKRLESIIGLQDKLRLAEDELAQALSLKDLEEAKLKGIGNIIDESYKIKEQIYQALMQEFEPDLDDWKAEIERETLTIKFNEPDIFFESGSATVTAKFQGILSDFFPRYIRILEPFFDNIREVRIEGHTSSKWETATNEEDAFLENMKLSQDRTQAILDYCLRLIGLDENYSKRIKEKVKTAGFSSTKLKYDYYDREDEAASRRVEFTIDIDEKHIIQNINKALTDD